MRVASNEKSFFPPRASRLIFSIYSIVMFWELFLGPYRSSGASPRYNLIPLHTIANMVWNYPAFGLHIWFINLFGNVITFIPLGFLLPRVFTSINNLKKIIAAAFAVSLAAEVLQLLLNVGSFDVDDLILNIAGAAVGFGAHRHTGKSLSNYNG